MRALASPPAKCRWCRNARRLTPPGVWECQTNQLQPPPFNHPHLPQPLPSQNHSLRGAGHPSHPSPSIINFHQLVAVMLRSTLRSRQVGGSLNLRCGLLRPLATAHRSSILSTPPAACGSLSTYRKPLAVQKRHYAAIPGVVCISRIPVPRPNGTPRECTQNSGFRETEKW